MKPIIILALLAVALSSCGQKESTGVFTLSGNIRNIADQQIYLEELYFSDKAPEVIDTASIRNGKFELRGSSTEEGMFRIRMEKEQGGFIFINDASKIRFDADIKDMSLTGPVFHTKANQILKSFIVDLNQQQTALVTADSVFQQAKLAATNDSAITASGLQLDKLNQAYRNSIIQFIDTVSDPVVAMFAMGYTQGTEQGILGKSIASLGARFPKHTGVKSLIAQYNQYLSKQEADKAKASATPARPGIGDIAPDFTLSDPQGIAFSLSQLKGKYVLVDFWASWCGPCRRENPNLVAAYAKFQSKNFTILGVSLDEDKEDWLKAVRKDALNWKQVSDLKGWQTAVVPLYGFDGIPYNVLLDPDGRIIATELRGDDLEVKLSEVLK